MEELQEEGESRQSDKSVAQGVAKNGDAGRNRRFEKRSRNIKKQCRGPGDGNRWIEKPKSQKRQLAHPIVFGAREIGGGGKRIQQIAEMADFKHRFLNLRADLHMERVLPAGSCQEPWLPDLEILRSSLPALDRVLFDSGKPASVRLPRSAPFQVP